MILTALCRRLGLSRAELVAFASEFGIVHFLSEHYELLHYYDNSYVVEDVLSYVNERSGYPDGIPRTV